MRTSAMYTMNLSQLYTMRKNTWDKIKKAKDDDAVYQLQIDMAYIQKVIEDREDGSKNSN